MKLAGKKAVVTGAAQGIGKAIALRLAQEGADVAVVDIRGEQVAVTAEEIRKMGVQSKHYVLDLLKTEEIAPLYDKIVEEFGAFDIAVQGAGIIAVSSFLDITEADWDRVMNINAKATLFCVQQAAKHMMNQCIAGRIINISSITSKGSRPNFAIYAASKAAINSITRSAATAFASSQIKVNAVCPGFVSTEMWDHIDEVYHDKYHMPKGEGVKQMLEKTPLNRSGDLQEIAALVAYLASPEADFITGQAINICGGAEMH